MRRQLALTFILPLLLAPGAVDARLPPLAGQPPVASPPFRESWRYTCDVEQRLAGGTVTLTRLFTDDGKPGGGDFMRWTAAGYDPQKTQRPLELELSYIWDPARQPAIDDRAIDAKLRVGIDADLPEVALLRIQRPFPVQPHGIIGSTALSTQIFPYGARDPGNGHGELPLGDLLAYAEGYDTLGWTLVRPSDRLGGDQDLARGALDIAALRQAVAALPALRAALAAKTADPRARCQRVLWPDTTRY
jgi:hypothetical protein